MIGLLIGSLIDSFLGEGCGTGQTVLLYSTFLAIFLVKAVNCHLLMVEEFVCPGYPTGYVVQGVFPLGFLKENCSWAIGQTEQFL